MRPLKTWLNWSSGKDAAMVLRYLLQHNNYSVEHLITTVNFSHNRVSMHGLRRDLLLKQVKSLGISHSIIELPDEPSMAVYENEMTKIIRYLQQNNFECTAFGDIFLEDIKKYREKQLAPFNIKTVFPLWKKNTRELMNEFIESGYKAIVVCIDASLLDISFAGRIIDKEFMEDLPPNVDVCGENGEFHTFCFDGPIFKDAIPFTIGEKVYREYKAPERRDENKFSSSAGKNSGFWFCDLLP